MKCTSVHAYMFCYVHFYFCFIQQVFSYMEPLCTYVYFMYACTLLYTSFFVSVQVLRDENASCCKRIVHTEPLCTHVHFFFGSLHFFIPNKGDHIK